ncbi:MAG: hypothetical protein HZB21_05820 [Deltaproteobacteria bacterium]|nr:hypothetical protein [Deltaproteobacteria bacterium]
MAKIILPLWFKEAKDEPCPMGGKLDGAPGFIEKSLLNIASFMKGVLDTEESASQRGFLQGLDARARMMGIFALMLASSVTGRILALAGILSIAVLLAYLSSISLLALAKRVLPVFVFTSVISLPLFFMAIGGTFELWALPFAGLNVWISRDGGLVYFLFVARVLTMASLVGLMALTTRQVDFFKGLGYFMPRFFVTALFMTFRYLFILLKTAEDAAFARKSRTISHARQKESQEWFASRVALILDKSVKTAGEVALAMASRGFTGSVKTFGYGAMGRKDYLWVGLTVFLFFLSLGM